jgi:DNA primase
MQYCQRGLFQYRDNYGNVRYQDFSNRILIPVFDLDGMLVSFQGRDITGKAEKKYLFPSGYASTGVHLYNGHNVHNTKRIIVAEGAFDVAATKIACDSTLDLRDVVCVGTFGKNVSYGSEGAQLDKFRALRDRGVEEVTFMWDGEVQATEDAVRCGLMLAGLGFRVKVAMLPKDKDPNEVTAVEVVQCIYRAEKLTTLSGAKILMKRRAMNAR